MRRREISYWSNFLVLLVVRVVFDAAALLVALFQQRDERFIRWVGGCNVRGIRIPLMGVVN